MSHRGDRNFAGGDRALTDSRLSLCTCAPPAPPNGGCPTDCPPLSLPATITIDVVVSTDALLFPDNAPFPNVVFGATVHPGSLAGGWSASDTFDHPGFTGTWCEEYLGFFYGDADPFTGSFDGPPPPTHPDIHLTSNPNLWVAFGQISEVGNVCGWYIDWQPEAVGIPDAGLLNQDFTYVFIGATLSGVFTHTYAVFSPSYGFDIHYTFTLTFSTT